VAAAADSAIVILDKNVLDVSTWALFNLHEREYTVAVPIAAVHKVHCEVVYAE
jgi:hypothetical protein